LHHRPVCIGSRGGGSSTDPIILVLLLIIIIVAAAATATGGGLGGRSCCQCPFSLYELLAADRTRVRLLHWAPGTGHSARSAPSLFTGFYRQHRKNNRAEAQAELHEAVASLAGRRTHGILGADHHLLQGGCARGASGPTKVSLRGAATRSARHTRVHGRTDRFAAGWASRVRRLDLGARPLHRRPRHHRDNGEQ
jgi:hypothetical protein